MFIDSTLSLGSDIMNGGAGSDTIEYSERTGDITVTLCTSTPVSCEAGACGCVANDGEGTEYDNLINIENVWTGNGNDKLTGNAADNTFGSGGGVDELRGEGGDDTLYAGPGDDILFGGPGDDMLSGDGGNDSLDGGDDDGDICVSVGKPLSLVACELL
jgi:Ca2+-binding RTX toxin-like protein